MLLEEFLIQTVRGAGQIVLEHFGQLKSSRSKGDRSDVLTEVDIETSASSSTNIIQAP